MKCSRCQAENEAGSRFCEDCGVRLEVACPTCGTAVMHGKKFCRSCGTALTNEPVGRFGSAKSYTPKHLAERILSSRSALEGERKQVTILFADLKGSMELLADRDPEDARALLDPVLERMMEAVHRYEGTVNQVMGDGIMALFGAPLAHEDHAVRACYAALRMQDQIRRYADQARREHGALVHVRIGINSGEVVVRSVGSDLHMDYTAVGRTTHLAARMEQMAMPGSILITAGTLGLAEGYVEVEPLGPIAIKGLPAPVDAYEVRGAGRVRTRLQSSAVRGLSRFVGRDAEMEQLRTAQEQAAGEHGQVVAVVGEPGVGKSRLFYEFIHSHRTRGWLVLQSASVSYGKATAYLPVIDLLKAYFRIEPRDDARTITEKVGGKVLMLDRALEDAIPAVLALLDILPEDSPFRALEPPDWRRRTLRAIKALLLRESRLQPLILVFEDLHWIDGETQAFLESLLDSLPAAAILLLVNYRPEYQHTWGHRTCYRQLRIDPLGGASADELLRALLGTDASLDVLKRLLAERTEGNPFFLEESVRGLIEIGALTGERGGHHLTRPVTALQVPASVQALLASRIDRLAPEDKQLLEVAAAIGKDVPYPLLAAVAGEAEGALQARLGRLQDADFLYETRLFPEAEYTFKHALTHEVAYSSTLYEGRRTLHARLVEAIEESHAGRISEQVERLAHHAVRAKLWDRAVPYLKQAGIKAAARSANDEAIAHLTKGLDALGNIPDSPDRVRLELDLQVALGPVLMTTKGYGVPEVERAYKRARELCRSIGDSPELFAVVHGLWLHYWLRGDIPTMGELVQQLSHLAQHAGDHILRLIAHEAAGEVGVYLGDFEAGRSHMEQAVSLYDPSQHRLLSVRFGGYDPGMAARAIGAHALWCLGYPDQALAWSRASQALARQLSHVATLVFALGHAGILHYLRQEPRRTLEVAEEALSLSTDQGLEFWKAFARILRGWSLVRTGQRREGLESMHRGLDCYRVTGGELESPIWLAMMADAYLAAGAPQEGLSAVAEALDLVNAMGVRFTEAELFRLRGELLVAQSGAESEEAAGAFRRSFEVAAAQNARCLELRAAKSLVRLEPAARDGQGFTHQTLADLYAWFTEGFDTSDLRETQTLLEEWS